MRCSFPSEATMHLTLQNLVLCLLQGLSRGLFLQPVPPEVGKGVLKTVPWLSLWGMTPWEGLWGSP